MREIDNDIMAPLLPSDHEQSKDTFASDEFHGGHRSVAILPDQQNSFPESVAPCETNSDRYHLVDRALDDLGAGWFSALMISLTGLGYFVEATEIGITSLLYPEFIKVWHLNETDLPVISSFMSIGMVIGCLSMGRLSDMIGRKTVYGLSVCLTVIFGFISSFATSVEMFASMRLFLGIGYGGCLLNATPFLLECTPAYFRGRSTAMMSFFWCLGTSFVVVLSWLFMETLGWNWIVRMSSLAGIPVVLGLQFLVPESPRFYVMKGDYESAVRSMERIAIINRRPLPVYFNTQILAGHTKFILDDHTPSKKMTCSNTAGTSVLCKSSVLKTLVPLCAVWFVKSFGMGIVGFFPLKIKEQVGGEDTHYRVAMVTQVGEWIGAVFVATVAHKLPRILEIRFGLFTLGLMVILIGLAGQNEYLIYMLLIILRIAMAVDFHGLYTYSPELFPTSIRVAAFSICQLAQRSAPIVSPYLLTHLDQYENFQVTTAVFGGCLFSASFLTCFLFRETANTSMVELDDDSVLSSTDQLPLTPSSNYDGSSRADSASISSASTFEDQDTGSVYSRSNSFHLDDTVIIVEGLHEGKIVPEFTSDSEAVSSTFSAIPAKTVSIA